MNQVYEKLIKCTEIVKAKANFEPEVALILGSGLGEYAKIWMSKWRFHILRSKDFRCPQ